MSDTRAMRLLSLAAHELRTPAGVIGGCLRIVRMAITSDDAARRDYALAQAERNYERVVELLAEMSDLWRLETGQAVFNRAPTAVAPILERAVTAASARLTDEVPIAVEAAVLTDIQVVSDPVRLERALTALVLAVARRTTGQAGITVRAARIPEPPPRLRLVFAADHGNAPPDPDAAPDLLDEFESGLGLALPIARLVIEADGGTVCRAGEVQPPVIVAEWPVHV